MFVRMLRFQSQLAYGSAEGFSQASTTRTKYGVIWSVIDGCLSCPIIYHSGPPKFA